MNKIITFIAANKFAIAYLLFISVLPLLASSSIVWYAYMHVDVLKNLLVHQKIELFFVLSFCMALALVPTTIVCFLSGVVWGFDSLWLILPSYFAAQIIGYQVAKSIGAGRVTSFLKSKNKWSSIFETISEQERMVIVLLRVSPILPFAVTNMVLSTLPIRYANFLFFGLIGMLPRSLFVLWLGMVSSTFLQTGKIPSVLTHPFTIFLISISLAGFAWIFFKKKKTNTS